MLNLPIYSNKKLITAFEYGINMSEASREKTDGLRQEIVKRMEDIILKEFPKKDWRKLNGDMFINILAAFEPK